MPLLLYIATAAALLLMAGRWIRPVSRVASAILALLPFCFVGYALIAGRVYAPVDLPYATEPLASMKGQYGIGQLHNPILSDVAAQMIPWRKAVQSALANHEWPIWNPFILSGDILAAAAQPAAYSPFTLLACLLPVAVSFTYSAAICFFVAALGGFLFARELGCGEAAALIGAAVFCYSTDIAFFVLWPLGFSWAFLPFVLLGTRRVVRTPSIHAAALLATAFSLMLLAGHPETALHIVAVAFVYAIFEIAFCPRLAVRAVLAGVSAGIAALLVCAVYVLPVAEAVGQTEQHSFRAEVFAVQPRGASTANVVGRLATDVLPSLYMTRWSIPQVNDLGADTAAVGSIALFLSMYAIWRVRSRDTWFLTALAIFALLARSGWPPVVRLLQKLPLFDVSLNERLSFAAAFALAMLAAIGVEEVSRREHDRPAVVTAFIVLLLIATATVVITRRDLVDESARYFGRYTAVAEIAGLAAATALLALRIRPQWTVAGILGLILVQRTLSAGDIYKTFPASAAYPRIPLFDALKNAHEPFRIAGYFIALVPNSSALYELEDVRGYEAMTLNLYSETWRIWSVPQAVSYNRVDDLTKPFLSFLNVRYAIAPPNDPAPPGWRIIARQRGCTLVENMNVIARAFVPRRVRFYEVAWQAVNDMMFERDFRERAWIRASPSPGERDNGPGRVTIARRQYGYSLVADMERDGWVVVSEAAWKGWRAYVDGQPVEPQLANAAFLSVFVPAGHHRIKLLYKPQSFVTGRNITVGSMIVLLIIGVATVSITASRARDSRFPARGTPRRSFGTAPRHR